MPSFDWLESHSPMNCDWGNRVLNFQDRGETVQLLGDLTEVREVTEILVLQLKMGIKGNDIWGFALLEPTANKGLNPDPTEIHALVDEFQDVFAVLTSLPPS